MLSLTEDFAENHMKAINQSPLEGVTPIWQHVELDGGFRRKSLESNKSKSPRSHFNDFHFEVILHTKILSLVFVFSNNRSWASEPPDIDLKYIVRFCEQSSKS